MSLRTSIEEHAIFLSICDTYRQKDCNAKCGLRLNYLQWIEHLQVMLPFLVRVTETAKQLYDTPLFTVVHETICFVSKDTEQIDTHIES